MTALLENIWQLLAMAVLLGASAFLSGSETAFFNLSRRQIENLKSSENSIQNLAANLLTTPKILMTSLLFCNMAVNVLYFALSSILCVNVSELGGNIFAGLIACISFGLLLLFGEMLPKSFAFSSSQKFCAFAAPACFVMIKVLSPLLRVFDFFIINPGIRLLTGPPQMSKQSDLVTVARFKSIIESSKSEGLISEEQTHLFSEVIELGMLKVRHVFLPRVDMLSCCVGDFPAEAAEIMNANELTKLAVIDGGVDNIVGLISLRDIILNNEKTIKDLLKPVEFVPEQKTVESLLEHFRKSKTDMAIVVDEYGQIAGSVSIEDIVEEIVGPLDSQEIAEPIEMVGPLSYRLAGGLSIHEWAETFGIDPGQTSLSTLGGFTTALLGKIPNPGDFACFKNLKLTVESVEKNRIKTLILSLEGTAEQDGQEQ
jgi:putative hemolysin